MRTSTPGAGDVEVHVTVADFHGNGVPAVAGPATAVVDAVIRAIPATIHLRRAMDDLHRDVNKPSRHSRALPPIKAEDDHTTSG
ncbi:hypothetical protein GCM10027176_79520 [Actinoallomurus bryophytorum]